LPREEIERWQSRIDEMPERLRGGPLFLVGQAYLARGEKHRAAAAFLWLPTVYDQDAELAAVACVEAAKALADIGQKYEAALLYREAADRFPGTPPAEEAAGNLQELDPATKETR
jgi:TolA-binding protein